MISTCVLVFSFWGGASGYWVSGSSGDAGETVPMVTCISVLPRFNLAHLCTGFKVSFRGLPQHCSARLLFFFPCSCVSCLSGTLGGCLMAVWYWWPPSMGCDSHGRGHAYAVILLLHVLQGARFPVIINMFYLLFWYLLNSKRGATTPGFPGLPLDVGDSRGVGSRKLCFLSSHRVVG